MTYESIIVWHAVSGHYTVQVRGCAIPVYDPAELVELRIAFRARPGVVTMHD